MASFTDRVQAVVNAFESKGTVKQRRARIERACWALFNHSQRHPMAACFLNKQEFAICEVAIKWLAACQHREMGEVK